MSPTAIVGEAVVRVRVISNTLSRDIANNVRDGFRSAGPEFDRSGRDAGRRAGAAAAEGVRESTPALRRAGGDIGQRFADAMDNDIRRAFRRAVIPNMQTSLRNGIRGGFRNTTQDIVKSFDFKAFSRAGANLGKELHKGFNLGIGAARMGPAVRSALLLALPSVLSGAGALGAAMASQIVSSLAAAGPAIAGAGGILTAGLATAALNAGLLALAFKAGNEELKALGEEFKEFLKDVGKPIAAGMVNGLRAGFESIQTILPEINGLLSETGEAFGRVAENLGATLARGDNLSRIYEILKTNNSFIETLNGGLAGLTTSFLILFKASKPFIDAIGQAINDFGEWAAQILAVKEANGELGTFMQTILDKFRSAAETIGDFVVGLYNVFKAAAPAAGAIGEIADKFRAWTENPENQERMERFFEKMSILSGALIGLFGGLAAAAGGALEKMDPGPILKVFEILTDKIAPALADLWNQVQAGAGENLVKIFENLGTMLEKIVQDGTFETIARFLTDLLVRVSEFLASDFGSTIAGWLIPLGLFGGVLTTLIGPLTTVAGLITGPIAATVGVIAAVAAAFATVYANSEAFRNAIGGLISAMAGTFSEIWDKLVPKIQALWQAFQELAGVIGDRLAPVIEFLTPIVQRVFNFIGDTLGNFIDYIKGFIDILIGVFTGDWGRVWEGVVEVFTAVWNQIVNVFTFVKDMISNIWDGITAVVYNAGQVIYKFFASVWSGISGVVSDAWNAVYEFTAERLGDVRDFILDLWNGVIDFFTGLGSDIGSAVSDLWNDAFEATATLLGNIRDEIVKRWNDVVTFLNGIATDLGDAIGGAWDWLTEHIGMSMRRIRALILQPWNAIVNFLRGIWERIVEFAHTYLDPIIDYLSDLWDRAVRGVTVAWNNVAQFFADLWAGIMETLHEWFDPWIDYFSELWTTITDNLTTAWNAVVNFFVELWAIITEGATTAWNAVATFFYNLWNTIYNAIVTAWNTVATFFTEWWARFTQGNNEMWNAVTTFLSERWEAIRTNVTTAWNAVLTFFTGIWNDITTTFHTAVEGVMGWLSDRWDDITSTAEGAWTGLVGIATRAWDRVTDEIRRIVGIIVSWLDQRWTEIVETARGIWNDIHDAIVQPVIDAYNDVVTWVGKIAGAIANIASQAAQATVALPVVGLPGGPALPGSAEGGIFRPTPGGVATRIAEKTYAERVEPLDPSGLSVRDRAIIKELSGGGEGGPTIVKVYIGQQELDVVVDTRVEKANKTLGRSMSNGKRI